MAMTGFYIVSWTLWGLPGFVDSLAYIIQSVTERGGTDRVDMIKACNLTIAPFVNPRFGSRVRVEGTSCTHSPLQSDLTFNIINDRSTKTRYSLLSIGAGQCSFRTVLEL